MISALARLRREESGLTLIELLIVMLLMGFVSSFVLVAVKSTVGEMRITNNESQGLSDTQTVIERLARDIRDARSVYAGADATHLQLWIDYNSDYILDPVNQANEIITWQISTSANGQYNVLRQYQGGQPVVQARTLVQSAIFCYSTDTSATTPACLPIGTGGLTAAQASSVRLVTVTLTYNPGAAGAGHTRTTTFSTRLRNVS